VAKQSARSVLKKGASELETLKGDAAKIKEKIAAAKEKNAAKVQELFEARNEYPAEVSALICCFQIVNTDCFLSAGCSCHEETS
jgi:hypothetical protein